VPAEAAWAHLADVESSSTTTIASEAFGPNECELTFSLDGEGPGAGILGRLFAAIYARNLDRAIPRLVRELERSS
jgi:hypothetical protein